MDYEKKYKGALSFLKDLKPHMSNYCIEKLEGFFPELKESKDERIRKATISFLEYYEMLEEADHNSTEGIKECIAWLEKQGQTFTKKDVDDAYLKGVCDAKQELEKQSEQKSVISDDALREGIAHFGITQYQIDNWLKKYVDVEKQGEQNPAWSEEDEKTKSLIISTLTSMGTLNLERYHYMNLDEVKNWLKSLKDRIQPKQEWSDIDEQMLEAVLYDGENALGERHKEWIKNLKYRVKRE